MKIKTKISLVFTLMTGTILFMLSCLVYVVSLEHARDYFFTRLKVRASISADSHFGDKSNNVQEIRQRHLQRLPREQAYFFRYDSLTTTAVQKHLPGISDDFVKELKTTGAAQSHDGFQHYAGISYPSTETGQFVIASAYDENGEDHLTFLRNALILGFSVACLLVFVLGQAFSNRIMTPFSDIISEVHQITTTNLSQRIRVSSGQDQISDMANTFNDMLDRLETTFELQRNFIANASHEFNTPLTAILGETEVILQNDRAKEEYITSLKVVQNEARKMQEITSSLLKLSNISFEGHKQKIEAFAVDELLMSIKIGLDQRTPQNRVRVMIQNIESSEDAYKLVGSSPWMELALTNIIQNSIKYSNNEEVLVTLSASQSGFFLEISDTGIGIPKEDLQHIFEPFFRGSNTAEYAGYGIGLPLAARIIKLHGGSINIFSKANSGTKVTLQFPGKEIKIP